MLIAETLLNPSKQILCGNIFVNVLIAESDTTEPELTDIICGHVFVVNVLIAESDTTERELTEVMCGNVFVVNVLIAESDTTEPQQTDIVSQCGHCTMDHHIPHRPLTGPGQPTKIVCVCVCVCVWVCVCDLKYFFIPFKGKCGCHMNNKQNHVQKIHSVRVCNNRQARLISEGLIIEYIVLLEMLMTKILATWKHFGFGCLLNSHLSVVKIMV